MSNVLIGIIGVILFIGLALAGALFLGPRFQESTQNSKASAAIQAVSQISHAANLYRLNEGTDLPVGAINELKDKGYLKSIPTFGDAPLYQLAPDGCAGCANPKSIGVVFVLSGDASARKLCEAVMRQVGGLPAGQDYNPPGEILVTTIARRSTGCAFDSANYFIYSRY
jgi:type II secretory pathway pseudopilin PulG